MGKGGGKKNKKEGGNAAASAAVAEKVPVDSLAATPGAISLEVGDVDESKQMPVGDEAEQCRLLALQVSALQDRMCALRLKQQAREQQDAKALTASLGSLGADAGDDADDEEDLGDDEGDPGHSRALVGDGPRAGEDRGPR